MERFAGRYTLLRLLGQGGMGTVHLALDLTTGRECALKRMHASSVGGAEDTLRHEFELLTRVRHPAVVSVLGLGFAPDGVPFYTMEYVPGAPANLALPRGDWRALCFAAAEVAHGLEALHEVGVLHGDLKPSNLLVIPGGESGALPAGVRILDFGLAAVLGRDDPGHRGTPGFAAPEVVRGDPRSVSSDLYGFGATLLALATGRVASPSTSNGSRSRGAASLVAPAVELEEAGVPAPLLRLILQLMAPAPGERPRDAREVRTELERIEPAARQSLAQRLRTELVTGRGRELARLERWLARTSHGSSILMLSGEPGAGKSALLAELAIRAELAGHCVIPLSCAEFPAPCALAAALCRRLAAEAGDDADGSAAEVLSLLDRPESVRSEGDVARLADAAVAWTRRIHARGALPLLLLDDRDQLDRASSTLLRRILFHPQGGALRCIWAGRGDSGEAVVEDRVLLASSEADELVLRPLDHADVERLVSARLHRPAPRDLLETLFARAGGHPGLLVEMLRVAAERGLLREDEDRLFLDVPGLASLALPDGFEASLARRFAALPSDVCSAARLLAVLARPARSEELLALDPSLSASAVEELRAAGLLSMTADGSVALNPPASRKLVLDASDDAELRRLHRLVLNDSSLSHAERFSLLVAAGETDAALAEAETAFATDRSVPLALEAAALAGALAPSTAAAWLERAAEGLIEQGRHTAAIPHLEHALELEPDRPTRFWRWRLLSSAYLRADRLDDLEALVARAEAGPTPQRERSLILSNGAARLFALGQTDAALAMSMRALELAHASGDHESVAVAELTVAAGDLGSSLLGEAALHAIRAGEAFERAGLPGGQARALGQSANVAMAAGDRVDALRLHQQALAIARHHGHRLACQESLLAIGGVQISNGQLDTAHESFSEALRIALEDGRQSGVVVATANLALLDGLTGRSSLALRRSRASVLLARTYLPRFEPFAWRTRVQALRVMGRARQAERAMWRAVELASKLGLLYERDWLRLEYVRLCAGRSRWQAAGDAADRALERAGTSDPVCRILLCAWAGRAALRQRDHASAAARLAQCDAELKRHPAPLAQAHALQLRAELALQRGDLALGTELARLTLAAFAGLPSPPDRATAALEFARLARTADANSGVPVGEWLIDAASTFERVGDLRNRMRSLALLVDANQRVRRAPTTWAHERDLLKSVGILMDSLADLQLLERRAMQMAVEHLDAERGVLLLTDPSTGQLEPIVEHGAIDATTRDRAVSYSRRVVERVADSGGSLLISDAPSNPDMLSESVVGLGLRSILCVPLYGAGKVVGAVYVDDSRRADAFAREDRALLEGFAHLMATAIGSSQGHEEVRRANEQLVGENLSLRREARARFKPHNIIGHSSAMQAVLAVVERAAQTNATVLITGENGTGKELLARILHHSGRRHAGPFVGVNCGAIPETLLESELFGILPSVATGVRGRDGRFVQANGGTLFLDEIGEMPMKQQVALLAVISNREITPVGGGRPITVDVRIIAATNRDLRRSLEEGSFREDLYYRLNVIPLEVPPLRDRKADIPAMAHHFAQLLAGQQEREVPRLSPEFIAALMQSDWPGNVRELQNYMERVMAMTADDVLRPDPLPRDLESKPPRSRIGRGRKLTDVMGELEQRLIREALERSSGNQSRAARELGLTEPTLRYRMAKFGSTDAREKLRGRKKLRM